MTGGVLLRWPWPGGPLLPAIFLRRYKRFFADFQPESDPNGPIITAHCVNTGRMEGLLEPGRRCWLSLDDSPTRKLKYTWQTVEIGDYTIGANTGLPNRLVKVMLEARVLPGFEAWTTMRPEAPYAQNSRVDFLVTDDAGAHYLEVKNCHLVYTDNIGYFPDTVSERATRHVEELAALARDGHRATVLFTVQRADVLAVRPSDRHDPAFAGAARRAAADGVRFMGVEVVPSPTEVVVRRVIPADMQPYV